MEAVNALLRGEVDLASTAEFPLVKRAFDQEKISAIASIDKSQVQKFIARIDRGIESASDLKGKKIGVTLGTISHFYLARFLAFNNINLQEVTLVNINPADSLGAITKGDVDAMIIWQPYVDAIENALGDNALTWLVQDTRMTYIIEVAKNDWIAQNPDIVLRFIKALSLAENYLNQNQEQTKLMIQKKLNYTNSYMATTWGANQFSLALDQAFIMAMEDEARWMMENKLTAAKEMPNFLDYIYLDAMEQIRPESVTIIR